ncbi:hypothetical protein A5893_03075 [Pedobacter psychrophilus]|uniref:Uncharacterized protein n=1 Tax=Pedobacter psychrophilus TaxID=1826909 RepID=A0A179DMU4_9SPHI|nr:hypothetical protein [Pedobacter psychrophilus]OAQ42112.1 hypothetical protein A5893_03075 [Pedobacter psychrophilus]
MRKSVVKMNEPKTLSQDLITYNAILSDYSLFSPILDKVVEDYEKLGLGALNAQVWDKIKYSNTDCLEREYLKTLNDQLDSAGIRSDSMRKINLKDWQLPLIELGNLIDQLHRVYVDKLNINRLRLDLTQISFIDGKFEISEETKTEILLGLTVSLNSPTERLIYERLIKTAKAMTDTYELAREIGFIDRSGWKDVKINYVNHLIKQTENGFEVDNNMLRWQLDVMQRNSQKII